MPGWTNRGKMRILNYYFRRQGTLPTNFYMALLSDAVTPNADTNVMADVAEIPAGNGYISGGQILDPGVDDFNGVSEIDALDYGSVTVRALYFLGNGGNLPASGNGARWAVITDDNAVVANREILCYWSLDSNRIVSNGQNLILQSFEIQAKES